MKTKILISVLFFILISIIACEDDSVYCWECQVSYETTMWDVNRLRLGVPLNTDTTITLCGLTEDDISKVERVQVDSFIVNDNNLYCKTITNIKCNKK